MKNMFRFVKLSLIILSFSGASALINAQNAWINEVHYDNTGTDVSEFIEVVIENPGSYNLADFQVVLYNLTGGATYDTDGLETFTVGTSSGSFTLYYLVYPVNGIQNGPQDGIALVYQGTVISGQFLSYEGVLTATNGPAAGLTSVDIGVLEPGSDPVGLSLQLSGSGTNYGEFAWQPPADDTPGALNNGQTLSGTVYPEPSNYPTNFAGSGEMITITLTWTDATGTQLPAKYLVKASDQDNITPPVDGVPENDDANLTDGSGVLNIAYGTQTCSFNRLPGGTQFFFKIYPYTNSGSNINFKTNGTAPSATVTTEPVLDAVNFEDQTFGTWSTYSVSSDENWITASSGGGALGTAWQAQMNGYHADDVSNDWMISPSLNLNYYDNEKMNFYSRYAFTGLNDELTLKYSTNYTSGDPTAASWTSISFTMPATTNTWASSGIIDLSGITGSNVHVAFQYLNIDTNTTKRWNVDEIVITGYATVPIITVTAPAGGESWQQGTSHDISWTVVNTQANIKIEVTSNASAGTPTWTVINPSLPASQGTWTWNIPSNQTVSEDCQIRITDFASRAFGLSGIFSVIEPIVVPDLIISELMYNPPESGTDSLEFLEIYNNDGIAVNLEGYYFSAGIDFIFPDVTLAPGEYILVAADSIAFLSFFGETAYDYEGGLNNSGELVQLNNQYDMFVDSVHYLDTAPWPTEADGQGPSMEFCDYALDNGLGENWATCVVFVGINTDGDSVFASPGAGCSTFPTANFTADNTIITPGGSVNFTDESTGEPTFWVWTFVGGAPSSATQQTPPPIVYNTPGSYSVSLYVENAAGSHTLTQTDYIHVGVAPTAAFTFDTDTVFINGSVNFTDQSTGEPTSWSWEFQGGNPATSTGQNPTITYPTIGSYDVSLTVQNMFGNSTLLIENAITVVDPVGIGEAGLSEMNLYPNPASSVVYVGSKVKGQRSKVVEIFNVYGNFVKGGSGEGEIEIDVKDLPAGMYFVRIFTDDDKPVTHRLIVTK